MKKKISRGCAVLLACAMLAGLLMTTAFARASDYLAIYSVWASAKPDGRAGSPSKLENRAPA